MAKISTTWIVQLNSGQIGGPYTAAEIMDHINEGFITGEEKIAIYPGGKWEFIAKEPIFYEKILEILTNEMNPNNDSTNKKTNGPHKKSQGTPPLDETVIIPYVKKPLLTKIDPPSVPKPITNARNSDNKKKLTSEEIKQLSSDSIKSDPNNSDPNDNVIELKNLIEEKKDLLKDILRWPLFISLMLIAAFSLYFGFFDDSSSHVNERIRLLAPKKSQITLSDAQVLQKTNLALKLIAPDNVEGYIEAQNILVNVIENSLNNLMARMLLCEVYKELWYFSFQDYQDQKTVSTLAKTTKSLNKIDTSGYFCEAVKLYSEGRFKESLNTLDTILEKDFSNFLLYQMKGELLEMENETLIAESFFQKSRELSGQWVKPLFFQAKANFKLKDLSKANNLFLQAIKENKKHKASYFGLGLLEFSRNQYDKASNYINSGMDIDTLMDKGLEAQGFEALSEVHLIRGNKRKALEIANLNLKKNPSRKLALELCNRLGGCDKSLKYSERPDEELLFNCQLYLRQKEYVRAQAECKAAFELNPKNSTAALKASEALWNLGQGLEAVDWVNKSIKADTANVKSYLKKAEFLSHAFDFSEAEKTLIQADYLSKGNYEIQRGFANLAYKKKDYLGTLKLAEKALKIFDADIESVILYSAAARELTNLTKVTNQKEQAAREKMSKDAYSFALKAIELDSTNVEAQINYAKVLATRQGVDDGGDYLIETIKKYPSIYEYRIALAEIYIEEDRFKQASETLEKVLSLNESNKVAHILLGKCYNQLGQIEKSIGEYLKASYLDPSDAEPIFEVAKIYLEASKISEAKNQFERVIRLNQKFPRAHLFLGKTYLLDGNFLEAEKNAELEKKLYPGLIDSYILVGEIKYASKNYSECAAEYTKATNTGTQPVYVYVRAARCYRLAGQIDMAQGFLDIAAERESGFEDIYKEQGAIFEARGDRLAAVRSYCKYLDLSPNSKDKEEFLSQIQNLGGSCGD